MGDWAAGTIVDGKFRVVRVIGRGGMGVVYEVVHLGLDKPVALKVLNDELVASEEVSARFVQEARAVAKLSSPYVCRALDVGKLDAGSSYMVMELLEGRSVAALLRAEQTMTLTAATDAIIQVCHAVAEAHRLGIVHRDLKPDNIFLTEDSDGGSVAKVLDFGISKMATSSLNTATGAVLGTPQFMSPEQLTSTAHVDARADVWALGVCLFQMLAGTLPVDDTDAIRLAMRILVEPMPSLGAKRPDLPEEVVAVVSDCLQKNVDDRIASADELARRLAPFATPEVAALTARVVDAAATREESTHPDAFLTTVGSLPAIVQPTGAGRMLRSSRGYFAVAAAAGLGAIVLAAIALGRRRDARDGVLPASRDASPASSVAVQTLAPPVPDGDALRMPEKAPVYAATFSPAAKLVIAVGGDGERLHLRTFDLATRSTLREETLHGTSGSFFSTDGEWLGTILPSGSVNVVSTLNGTVARRFASTDALVVVPFGDGEGIVVGHADKAVRLWKAEAREGRPLGKTLGTPNAIRLDGASKRAVAGDTRGAFMILDLERARSVCAGSLGDAAISAVAISADGTTAAVADGGGAIGVFDASNCSKSAEARATAAVSRLRFGPDGRSLLVAAGANLEVRAATDAALRATFRGHAGAITTIGVSRDGMLAVTGALDGTLRTWRLP